MNNTLITIIVLTYDSYANKYGCIEHTILALINQKNVNMEIIIVNNGSSALDYQMLKEFCSELTFPIKIIKTGSSIAEARNSGAKFASGKLLFFVDEDAVVVDDFALSKAISLANNHSHGYGAKRDWTPGNDWFLEYGTKIKMDLHSSDYSFLLANAGLPDASIRKKNNAKYLVRSFIGNFGFVKADVFADLGGFPLQFKGYGLEDDAFSFLCYLKFGEPAILNHIHTVHITHAINEKFIEQYNKNLLLYKELLHYYGYKAFHIGDLLYPELRKGRPILEML